MSQWQWWSRLERSLRMQKVGSLNPTATDLSLKTGSDSSTAKHSTIGVPGVLENDHYKRMSRFTVGEARLKKNSHCSMTMSAE